MSERYPYQAHVALNLYGASQEDLKHALAEAYQQLSDGIPESRTELSGHSAAFTFKVTQHNPEKGPGPIPTPPERT